MKQHLDLLGVNVTDKITGVSGIVDSICFDLYGCVQASVRRGLDKEGKPHEAHWYDVKRLVVTDPMAVRVMEPPDFSLHEIGAADKPTRRG
jgi:hypothetical protein